MSRTYHLEKPLEGDVGEVLDAALKELDHLAEQLPHGLHVLAYTPDPDYAEKESSIEHSTDHHDQRIRIRLQGAAVVALADNSPPDDDGDLELDPHIRLRNERS